MCHATVKLQRKYSLHDWFVLKAIVTPSYFWLIIVFLFCSSFYGRRSQTFSHCFFCWNTILFPHRNQKHQQSSQDHLQENRLHTCIACLCSSGPISKTHCTLFCYNAVTEQIKAKNHPLTYKTSEIPHDILKVRGWSNWKWTASLGTTTTIIKY